jgi:plasmid stability protein
VAQVGVTALKSYEVRATRADFRAMIGCMRTSQLKEVSSTRFNVVDMSKMIQVRNVPDEMHQRLKMRALAEGISLSDLIKRELGIVSGLLSFEELDAQVKARRGSSRVKSANIVRYIRESRGEF